jgi:hypothetical protein
MSWLRLRSRRRDRGVSVPEYALIAAVLITALAAVLQGLTDKAGDKLQTTGDQVATGAPAPTTSSTSTPPVSSTSTTLAPTTTTTAAPTTTSTTAAPTTTSTTTAAAASVGTPTWGTTSGSNGTWMANGQYTVTSGGQPVAGAGITVRSRECTWFFIWVCGSYSTSGPYTTGSNGSASVSLPAQRNTLYIEVQVTGVSMPPGKTWDGAANSSTVATPYQ